jgi:membrane-bound serine protease (ClpP class)
MLNTRPILFVLLVLCIGSLAPLFAEEEESARPLAMVATVEGVINPVASEFIGKSIEDAHEQGAEVLIIELDTPGGLMDSMRDIIKKMIASDVPVVVFVSPSGARAASAGAFITLASHVAAMAPQTNIGAAHPVGVGQDMDETMAEKVTNDAVAYIKSLAERHGRNTQWAEDAVRKSISSTEQEALEANVIDLVTDNTETLLRDINGWKVITAAGEKVLNTEGADIVRVEMGLRHKILDLISNPNVAYILMILGFYGLFFELTNPGAIFPGVTGAICLILAFYAFQTLPVNYAGLLLILLAVVLFILETQIASYGLLTIGGIGSMILGSLMLFETGSPFVQLSLSVIIASVLVTAAFFLIVIRLVVKAHRRRPASGSEGMVGEKGVAHTDISPAGGQVALHGEFWSASAEEHLSKGEKVVVESMDGLKVKVKKIPE